MGLGENFRIALRALAANKLRSALTMLGIIIGVGAVVALMAIGNGATASITSQVQGIGSNLVTVFPGRFERGGQNTIAYLYYTDYEALRRLLQVEAGRNQLEDFDLTFGQAGGKAGTRRCVGFPAG